MPSLISLSDIREAAERIRPIARTTPLVDASSAAGRPFFLKCESLQPGGAFKIRGAYNMVARLAPEQRARGVITYSSGNHGQAMALAARQLGAPAVVVMPTTAPPIKVEGARSFGAEVIFAGTTSARSPGTRRGGGRGTRPDDGAAVRSRMDHRRPGHGGPRDPRAVRRMSQRLSCPSAAAASSRASRRRSS